MAIPTDDIWPKILVSLREDLPDRTVTNWFEKASPELRGSNPPVLHLTLPSSFHREHIRDQYYSVLRGAGQEVLGRDLKIELRVNEDSRSESTHNEPKMSAGSAASDHREQDRRGSPRGRVGNASTRDASPQTTRGGTSGSPSRTAAREDSSSISARDARDTSSPLRLRELHRSSVSADLKARYTFENFVEGDSNALARSASAAVADSPGDTNYNPLLIYGGVGLGKTHLAQAIANHAIDRKTADYICYKSGEEFTTEFIQAIRNQEGGKFSKKYKGVDLLILDDIQFFSGKEKTQEEFFHLFNALYQKNKQIVLCADRPPKEIGGIEDRLLSRFEWGLSTDVQQPTLETRLAILQLKSEGLGLDVEQEVLGLMAESITTNIRQLEGALKQLSARAELMDEKIDAETARHFLEDQIQLPESGQVSPENVLNAVIQYYDISHEDLIGRSRREELVRPRHVAMYLCREVISLSFAAIGRRFGGRDHSTVSHACGKVNDRLDVEPELKGELDDMRREIKRRAARS